MLLFTTVLTRVSVASAAYDVCLYAGTVVDVRFVRYIFDCTPLHPPVAVISKSPPPRTLFPLIVFMLVQLTRVSCFVDNTVSTYVLIAF